MDWLHSVQEIVGPNLQELGWSRRPDSWSKRKLERGEKRGEKAES
jgi:hypothetical protein